MRAKPNWRWLFTPQATSLLLVVAVAMLAVITTQARSAAVQARATSVQNKTIIERQQRDTQDAILRERRAATAGAQLAADSIKMILAQETARANLSDRRDAVLIADLQRQLLAALVVLQRAIDSLAAQERQFAHQDRQQESAPTPTPTPSCLPVIC